MSDPKTNAHNAKLFLAHGFTQDDDVLSSTTENFCGFEGLQYFISTGTLRFIDRQEYTSFSCSVEIACELESIDQALELLAKQFKHDLYGHLPNQD